MDPRDFLDVAALLADEVRKAPDEAKYRSAVSRAYYALHNVVVGELAELGFNLRRDPAGHTKAAYYLTNSKLDDAIESGKILDSLRDERNEADYNMRTKGFNQITAAMCRARAQMALETFSQVSRKELKRAIADYLKRVQQ